MKPILILASLFLTFLPACKKQGQPPAPVMIRVMNSTGFSLGNIQVGEVVYGDLPAGQTTAYKQVTTPVYSPNCRFQLGSQSMYAGYLVCGTPPPPALAPGRYTFIVDTFSSQGFYPVRCLTD